MQPKPLIIERAQKTLAVERGNPRAFEVTRTLGRELVINRSMLPGPKGSDGVVSNPDDILDFIASFDGSLN